MSDSVATKIELPGEVVDGGTEQFARGPAAEAGREMFEQQMRAVAAAESVSPQDIARIRIR